MEHEILPCPFCGGEVAPDEYDDTEVWPEDSPKKGRLTYRAACNAGEFGADACGYCGPFADTESEATAAHNRIASAAAERDALRAENERLRAQVGQLRKAAPRAVEMLRVASEYVAGVAGYGHGPYDTIKYDGAECDGICVAGDCQTAMEDLAAALAATAPAAGEEKES